MTYAKILYLVSILFCFNKPKGSISSMPTMSPSLAYFLVSASASSTSSTLTLAEYTPSLISSSPLSPSPCSFSYSSKSPSIIDPGSSSGGSNVQSRLSLSYPFYYPAATSFSTQVFCKPTSSSPVSSKFCLPSPLFFGRNPILICSKKYASALTFSPSFIFSPPVSNFSKDSAILSLYFAPLPSN